MFATLKGSRYTNPTGTLKGSRYANPKDTLKGSRQMARLRPGKSCCRGRCVRTHDWKRDMRRILRRAIDAVRGRSEIGSLCLKDVRHEGLRIAIDEREPRALHLHHQTMSFEKRVVLRVEAPGVFRDRVR